MMSIPVSTVSQLVAAIKMQLSVHPEVRTLIKKKVASDKHLKNKDTLKTANIEQLITLRVKQIDQNDPEKGRKAFRIFLETILLSHLGESLINDPKFYQMVDEIHNIMEESPEVRKVISTAVGYLISRT